MRNLQKIKRKKRSGRHGRIRAKIKGTVERPRASVFRSNKHIYLQLINDEKGETLISVSDIELLKEEKKTKKSKQKKPIKTVSKSKKSKIEIAKEVGKLFAQKALERKIKQMVFDRGGYKYHGRVKAAAEGIREGGVKI